MSASPPTSDDRRLTPDDLDAYLRLREGSFGYAPLPDDRRAAFAARLTDAWGAFVGGALAASLTVLPARTYVAGVEVPFDAIAAVQTDPDHRRGGHAARLLRRSLAEARDGGVGWSLLYAFDETFYDRYGWVAFPSGVPLELPPERLPDGRLAGLLGVSAAAEGDGRGEHGENGLHRVYADDGPLRAAYARFARARTFADARRDASWEPWARLAGNPGTRILRWAGAGAFVVARLEDVDGVGVRLDVLDLGWDGPAGRAAVFAAIAAFRGQAARVRLEVPWDDPVAVERHRRFPRQVGPGPMARVADLGAALGPLRAVEEDDAPLDLPEVTVRIVDDAAPWNAGTWRLAPGPEGCAVTRFAAGATATLDVRGLTRLLAGAASPAAVRRVGWAEGEARTLCTIAALSGGRTPYRSTIDGF